MGCRSLDLSREEDPPRLFVDKDTGNKGLNRKASLQRIFWMLQGPQSNTHRDCIQYEHMDYVGTRHISLAVDEWSKEQFFRLNYCRTLTLDDGNNFETEKFKTEKLDVL